MTKFNKIAVIGSGVMGSGIAAQIANGGTSVLLLDIVPEATSKDAPSAERSAIALNAIERLKKTSPAPLMHPSFSERIEAGNLEDDAQKLSECDWIIEVVLEDLTIKHRTYELINQHRKKVSIISSNTSTIPLELLTKGFDDQFKSDFLITHFFNPPRYLSLLELVTSEYTRKDAIAAVSSFCDRTLGKGIVPCHDRPGFIANRIGTYWMQMGLNVALDMNMAIDLADAILSKPMGIPKTGLFGLMDLVGVDLIPKLGKSLCDNLEPEDDFQNIYREAALISEMIEAGFTGRKGKGGFTRMEKDENGRKTMLVLDLKAPNFDPKTAYRAAEKPQSEALNAAKKGLRAVMDIGDQASDYAWTVMSRTLAYAASLVPEVCDAPHHIDEAMRRGYNWKMGPFEMIDALGIDYVRGRLSRDGVAIPELLAAVPESGFYKQEDGQKLYFGDDHAYHPLPPKEGVLTLADLKSKEEPIFKTASAALWDLNDGALCLEFTGKMSAIDQGVFDCVHHAINVITESEEYKALILYSDGSLFSAGANLGLALDAMKAGKEDVIPTLVKEGQKAVMALKFAPFPVVAAPYGLALGGGCEFILHSDAVQAHAELYCGLVEVGVGLIPGWGGCKEMLIRLQERAEKAADALLQSFQVISLAKTAASAHDAKTIGYLKDSDKITMNRDRLLFDAKETALHLAKNYEPPKPREDIILPGPAGKVALMNVFEEMQNSGQTTPYDAVVFDALTTVLSGGTDTDEAKGMSEQDILDLEYNAFVALVQNQGTEDRIEHMLKKGKPLRN